MGGLFEWRNMAAIGAREERGGRKRYTSTQAGNEMAIHIPKPPAIIARRPLYAMIRLLSDCAYAAYLQI